MSTRLYFGELPPNASMAQKVDWCVSALTRLLDGARGYSIEKVADGYTVSDATLTETRTLPNPAIATTAQVANVLGTLLRDVQRRGPKGLQ